MADLAASSGAHHPLVFDVDDQDEAVDNVEHQCNSEFGDDDDEEVEEQEDQSSA